MALDLGPTSQPDEGSRSFLHQQPSELSASLARLVESVQQGDPLAPVTVVGPSTYANLTLRHSLARKGFANVRFLVFTRLAEFLGSPALAAQGRRPLTSILESAAVRAVTGHASGILAELGSHPSTIRRVKSAFRQLRHASPAALTSLGSRDQLRGEVVQLYRSFREQTREFHDSEDLAQAAAAAVRSRQAPGLSDLGFILFFQIRSLSPAQRELVAGPGGVGPMRPAPGPYRRRRSRYAPVEALAQELSPFLGSPERQGAAGESGAPNPVGGG